MIYVDTLDNHITEVDSSMINFTFLVIIVIDHWDVFDEFQVCPLVMKSKSVEEWTMSVGTNMTMITRVSSYLPVKNLWIKQIQVGGGGRFSESKPNDKVMSAKLSIRDRLCTYLDQTCRQLMSSMLDREIGQRNYRIKSLVGDDLLTTKESSAYRIWSDRFPEIY